jgi:hypothetical protein
MFNGRKAVIYMLFCHLYKGKARQGVSLRCRIYLVKLNRQEVEGA